MLIVAMTNRIEMIARLAARAGKDRLGQEQLLEAMEGNAAREGGSSRRIGFI